MRVSILIHDLHNNPIGRVVPIALALEKSYEVELIGLLRNDRYIYPPFAGMFRIITVRHDKGIGEWRRGVIELASRVSGDVLIAVKPMADTLLPGVLASRLFSRRPLIVEFLHSCI